MNGFSGYLIVNGFIECLFPNSASFGLVGLALAVLEFLRRWTRSPAPLAISISLSLAAFSHAAVFIATTSQATPGLPNFRTYTLSAVSTEPIVAVDFVGTGSDDPATGKGFFGPLNQVNPLGQPTIFQNNNPFIPFVGADVLQDSQFSVLSSNVVVPPGFAEESSNLLQAAWAWTTPQGTTVPVAQLVLPADFSIPIKYRGAITTVNNGVYTDFPVENFTTNFPPLLADVSIAASVNAPVQYKFTATDPDTAPANIRWSDFAFTGPGAAEPPTFDPLTQLFNWNPAGSQLGAYRATVRATDPYGAFNTGTLTINLVPEPASILPFATALVVLLSRPRRRSLF